MTKREQGLCIAPKCKNDVHAQDRCRTHYRTFRAANAAACKRSRCTEPRHALGLCAVHYARKRRVIAADESLNVRRTSKSKS